MLPVKAFGSAGPGAWAARFFYFNVKITAFVDGFNLYHSLAENPETKKYRGLI